MEGFPPNTMENQKKYSNYLKNLGLGHTHNTPNDQSTKKPYLNVLLLGILISHGQNQIQEIYTMQNFT